MIRVGILLVSDRGFSGERMKEVSGKAIEEGIVQIGGKVFKQDMVPDEQGVIASKLAEWADSSELDLIFTSGGTGFSPRDVTPEATLSILEKVIPGLGEAMRLETYKITPLSILSRATAGIRKRSLIINLPGSPQAVKECLPVILPVLPHALDTLMGTAADHPNHPAHPGHEKGEAPHGH